MNDAEKEHAFWEGKAAHSEYVAIEAIGPDPSAWDGELLERDLNRIFRALKCVTTPACRVVDLGCGIGRITIPLAQRLALRSDRPWEVVGVDISASMLRYGAARDRASQIPRVHEWRECGGRVLPGVGQLALAYSTLMFQHIPRTAAADYIKQIGEQTPSGGVLLFQTLEGTGGDFLWNEMTEDFVCESCTAGGFDVVELERVKPNTADNVTVLWVTAVKR
jgi:SAM-dependent methyltransferase